MVQGVGFRDFIDTTGFAGLYLVFCREGDMGVSQNGGPLKSISGV